VGNHKAALKGAIIVTRPASITRKPRAWSRFERRYLTVANAYGALGEACRGVGPLDEQAIALAKLAISVGANIGRTVHIHTKKALRAGVKPEAARQIAVVALPTIGLPRALEALTWIDESIDEMQVESKI
jgi:alkylhydroperoxidase/carboxymuconolactone decarboxylase family protein YurZ